MHRENKQARDTHCGGPQRGRQAAHLWVHLAIADTNHGRPLVLLKARWVCMCSTPRCQHLMVVFTAVTTGGVWCFFRSR